MALLDDVKSELAAIDNELPIAKKAQATAMIRFGNGLNSVDHHILVQVQLDSQDAAAWLQDTIKNLYGHEATLTPVSRQTPTGTVQRYVIRVPKGSTALVLQTGLYSRYTKNMVLGLPSDIINGKIAQIKSAWRGAFLANGRLSDPGKASYLEIVCPNHEAALALVSTARRLGITAKPRKLRSSERVTLRDPDAMISVVSMVRRGSVVVSFACGALLFRERNLRAKAVDLILILVGMVFLWLGSR